MNGNVSMAFIQRIMQFYLHGENTFSKSFNQRFLGDKGDKCLNSQEVQKTRNLVE